MFVSQSMTRKVVTIDKEASIFEAQEKLSENRIRHLPVVDAVVEQPFGATPGACYGYYWFDMPHFLEFRSICDDFRKSGNKDKLQAYYDKYIFGCETFDDFLAQKPYPVLKELRQKDGVQPIILD